ncbi:Serine/threonine-protein kinase fray2 [Sesamum angolense]|uniref:Serine/threonine-protein kinase fray2 n=1 Tax=Sesamum angolense TaxID=2727404 RepID=A0AAE2C6D6_9LAMI|nr:Serine/threonine-protein kinase fray2 [Sesamum angolense]
MEKEKEKKKYPIGAEYYTLYEEVGTGASATVTRALCIPLNEIVAVKIMDFERSNCNVAGNILIDSNGGIKLGDFGVSACLFDSGDRQRMRNTFVGTPCWMAPEVMEQMHGYDFKADIWSFGITALELAHGHAPFSKYPPLKVLLITLQNAPPGLDYERDKKFSKSFKQMIASCLVKDPSKRPSAKRLSRHSFFKQARSNDYIARTLLEGLPALGDRLQALKRHEEDMLAQKKMPDGEKEEISQNEYNRGISGWNFNLEDLKAQASLDDNAHISLSSVDSTTNTMKSEKSDDDASVSGSKIEHSATDTSPGPETLVEKPVPEVNKRSSDGAPASSNQRDKVQSQSQNSLSSVITNLQILDDAHPETIPRCSKTSCKSMSGDEVDEKTKNTVVRQKGRFKVTSESADIEKVVPGPMLPKSHSMQVIAQCLAIAFTVAFGNATSDYPFVVIAQRLSIASPLPSPLPPTTPSPSPCNTTQSNPLAQALFPCLQYVLHKYYGKGFSSYCNEANTGYTMLNAAVTEKPLLEVAHDREKELIREMTDLLSRLLCIQDELQKCKAESAQDNRNCCYMLSTCPETAPVTVGKCLQPTIRH